MILFLHYLEFVFIKNIHVQCKHRGFNIGDRWSIFSFRSSRNFVKIQITKVIYFSFTLYMFNLVLLFFSVLTMCMKNHNVNWCILGFYSKKHEKYTQTLPSPPSHTLVLSLFRCVMWNQFEFKHTMNMCVLYDSFIMTILFILTQNLFPKTCVYTSFILHVITTALHKIIHQHLRF